MNPRINQGWSNYVRVNDGVSNTVRVNEAAHLPLKLHDRLMAGPAKLQIRGNSIARLGERGRAALVECGLLGVHVCHLDVDSLR